MLRGLRRIRKSRGMTQAALASEIGVARKTIIRWEAGEQFPHGHLLETLAAVLDCKPEDLVADKPIVRADAPPVTAPLVPSPAPTHRKKAG